MSEMAILEVAIGLVFIYVVLSMLCTFINEWIARWFSLRSKNLQRGLKQLLQDPDMTGLAKAVLGHHLIKGSADVNRGPSYIAADTFARVVVDIIDQRSSGAAKVANTSDEIKGALQMANIPSSVQSALTGLIDDANTSIDGLRKNLQTWFDASMDRVSGWYKRQAQTIALCIAVVLAIGINADTVDIGRTLWQNPVLRAKVADQAALAVEACKDKPGPKECPVLNSNEMLRTTLEKLPIGWPTVKQGDREQWWGVSAWASVKTEFDDHHWLMKIFGWLVTALAVSLGAPFWFDVLNKLNSIRTAGNKPEPAAGKP